MLFSKEICYKSSCMGNILAKFPLNCIIYANSTHLHLLRFIG